MKIPSLVPLSASDMDARALGGDGSVPEEYHLEELQCVPPACNLISLGEENPLNGSLMIACAAAAAIGWTGGMIIAGFPSLHTFRPNPQRPTECVICGRRADAHRPN